MHPSWKLPLFAIEPFIEQNLSWIYQGPDAVSTKGKVCVGLAREMLGLCAIERTKQSL
jgi:hypothetical protein